MATGEYPGYTSYPAAPSNYSVASRPASNPINKIIVHVTQGSWAGTINRFQDSRSQVSAHYTVRSSDGAVGQPVREKDSAWHAGNWSYNHTSIGIEHEGLVDESKWFTEVMYRSSAQLTAYLCNKYGVPRARSHVIGHNEVPDPYDPDRYGGVVPHTDPGGYWDWSKYIGYVEHYTGTSAPILTLPRPRRRRRKRRR
jgi:N-acetyl-anhydromuramyl-L-alanine amidase AmpD